MKAPQASDFVSPVSGEPLKEAGAHWVSVPSNIKFPLIDGIPWLTPDPQRALADWQARAEGLVAHYDEQIAIMKEEISGDISPLTKERLKKHRTLLIKHHEFLKELLAPLKLKGKLNAPQANAFGYRLPANQGLLGYFQNLIRDWALRTGENEEQLETVMKALEPGAKFGRFAVLGSGGSRLAYDLHAAGVAAQTFALDINPVLFLATRRILQGKTVSLVEFPVAPKSMQAVAEARDCKAPRPADENFHQVFADCYHLPFANASLDAVLTPWLIDILPRPLEVIVGEINRVLMPGGVWINTGSLNFQLRELAKCYSVEEARELVGDRGFRMETLFQSDLPYLRSELSGHGRTETVTTFRARKTSDVAVLSQPDTKPEWLRDTARPVPVTQILQASRVVFDVQSYVLAQVDGQRSIDAIALLVSQRYGMPEENAREAVANFFVRNYEDAIFQR